MSSEELVAALNEGDLGYQQISSHVMFNGLDAGEMPLSRTFLLLGQRYAVDSHVLSNVVYDRATADSVDRRMMPDPLDVAFAALGNDQAAELLRSELETYEYAGDLKAMRTLVDGNDSEFWQQSLYNLWLGALRTLSPKASEVADPAAHGLPQLAGTEAWGRRMLNTQLASWAELRHDTLLYTKQSYTGANSCEFPDAYVDPYPAFYQALVDFADRGQAIIDALEFESAHRSEWLRTYFDNLRFVATMLGEMAEHQRAGEPFTEEQMAFVNDAVEEQDGCGSPVGITGWYNRLFLDSLKAIEFDPTIADVHTQPTLDGGQVVGRVLHVGTGWARQAVVTVDTCSGPKAYVGLVSSYFEHITEDFDRLDNARWSEHLSNQEPAEVEWMNDLVVR